VVARLNSHRGRTPIPEDEALQLRASWTKGRKKCIAEVPDHRSKKGRREGAFSSLEQDGKKDRVAANTATRTHEGAS